MSVVIALDLGTTSVRAIAFDTAARTVASQQEELSQKFPKVGWVEHDAMEIFQKIQTALNTVVETVSPRKISAMGITNQRETTVIWDKKTGIPIHNAIVWQCRRTAERCADLHDYTDMIQAKTGLRLDPYFSATKIEWLLDHVENARSKAENGELLFGTIDTWILWKLSQQTVHATDPSNASRTMLYNIHDQTWDNELLSVFNIPSQLLPEVKETDAHFATIAIQNQRIPIHTMIGDQQAALFTQCGDIKGRFKTTYGTGLFVMATIGNRPIQSKKLITTIAWKRENQVSYALEGPIFGGGSTLQWLRDGLGLIDSAADTDELARRIEYNDGVFFIPALTGLGAPHWNPNKTGAFLGLTLGTKKEHLIRAVLESLAYQTREVRDEMSQNLKHPPTELYVDGGVSHNKFLMQFQANVLNTTLIQPKNTEATALGAAAIAGIAAKFWTEIEFRNQLSIQTTYHPKSTKYIEKDYQTWRKLLQ